MKFIDLSTKDKITGERIKIAVSVISIILICVLATVGVVNIMEAQSRANREARASRLESMLADTSTAAPTSDADTSETTPDTDPSSGMTEGSGERPYNDESETSDTSDGTDASSTGTSDQTEDTSASAEETSADVSETETAATTEATTTETTAGITETPMYAEVYAAGEVNLRTGPGTEYDLVRTLKAGDKIDVIASTSNGWYKTYNGNYVLQTLTTATPPATTTTTAATTASTTAATTTASTTAAPTETTAAPTSSNQGGPQIDGMTYYGTCHITFYGPQPNGDGTYSTSTATGTTCSEGRTVAADWNIFPAGTTIYIANDPLGGDGYYTVEDRGSGVNGAHIDIYADDGESRSTTSAEVYIVN